MGVPFHHHHNITQQMANTTSTNIPIQINNQQQQASTLNVPKMIGSMGPNVDRASFPQQPPPMKVCFLCPTDFFRLF